MTLWQTLLEWLQQLLTELQAQLTNLWQDFLVRIAPVIEQLAPIWQDPLWQSVGLVSGLVILLPMLRGLLSQLGQWLLSLLSPALSSGKQGSLWLADAVVNKSKWIWQRLSYSAPFWLLRLRLDSARAWRTLRYLSTRKEWRYQQPWYLVWDSQVTELESSKTGWFEHMSQLQKPRLLAKEKGLSLPGSDWCFLEQGVLIRPAFSVISGSHPGLKSSVLLWIFCLAIALKSPWMA